MSGDEVAGVVVAHAELAAAMVAAVERIAGVTGALHPVSNDLCTPEELQHRVEAAVGSRPAVVFVDMASGSCAAAGRRVAASRDGVALVTGVSLPMLLDFVFHRDMEPGALARRVVGKGQEAARSPEAQDGEATDVRRAPEG